MIMFLDESGDHSLSKIDPQYPVFVLCGVIMDEEYHKAVVTPRLNEFVFDLFGRKGVVLHTLEFTRNQKMFGSMASEEFRQKFFDGLELLIRDLDFKIVACVVRKQDHLARYGLNAFDPYMLSLSILVERFIFECGNAGGLIVAESRGDTLNNALELAFLDLKIRGTAFISATKIRQRVHGLSIRDKKEGIAGLQLADIVASPIGRHCIGKRTYPTHCDDGDFYRCVEKRFRRAPDGNYSGMGLVVLPK